MRALRTRVTKTDDRCGATAVECAIVLPVFFLMLFGLMQIAWMCMIWHSMVHAARHGSRAYAVQGATQAQAQQAATDKLTELMGSASSQFTVTAANGPQPRDRVVTVSLPFGAAILDLTGGLDMFGILNSLSAMFPGTSSIDTTPSMLATVSLSDEAT